MCITCFADSGPSTPLPDKKLLLFILDRLQKCVFFPGSFQSFCIFVLLMFAFMVFSEAGEIYFFSIYNCRKDTYGVFSEPVDLNEVSILMMHLAFWTCLYAFVI